MIIQSLNLYDNLSTEQTFHFQLMREKILEQNEIILNLTWELDILREQTINEEKNKFHEEIRKEWI